MKWKVRKVKCEVAPVVGCAFSQTRTLVFWLMGLTLATSTLVAWLASKP